MENTHNGSGWPFARSLAKMMLPLCALVYLTSHSVATDVTSLLNNEFILPDGRANYRNIKTAESGDGNYVAFMTSGSISTDKKTPPTRVLISDADGQVKSNVPFTVAEAPCMARDYCTTIVNALDPQNSEIIALTRVWLANGDDYYLSRFKQQNGMPLKNTKIELARGQQPLGICRNSDGSILLVLLESSRSEISVAKFSKEGNFILKSKLLGIMPYRDFKFFFSQANAQGIVSFQTGGTTNFVLNVNEQPPENPPPPGLKIFPAIYPVVVRIDPSTAKLVSSQAYRTLLRIENTFAINLAAKLPTGDLVFAGTANGTRSIVGGNNGQQPNSHLESFWFWKVMQSGKIESFASISIVDRPEIWSVVPTAIIVSPTDMLLLSSATREGDIKDPTLVWSETDPLISSHSIADDSFGKPIWSSMIRKNYDISRPLPAQLWDIRSSLPTALFRTSPTEIFMAGTTFDYTSALLEGYKGMMDQGGLAPVLEDFFSLHQGFDAWKLRLEDSSQQPIFLQEKSHSQPFVTDAKMIEKSNLN